MSVFALSYTLTAMVYVLVFTIHKFLSRTKKLKDVKDIGFTIVIYTAMISYVATLLAEARFQNNSWYLIKDVGVPIPMNLSHNSSLIGNRQ